METHVDWLRHLCRLCGNQFHNNRQYSKYSVSSLLQSALTLDVSQDNEEQHPSLICSNCFRKLTRWREAKNQKKVRPLNIEPHNFELHGEICDCMHKDEEEVSAGQALHSSFKEHGKEHSNLIIHERSNRIHVVDLDDNGNSQKVLTVKEDGTWTVRVYGRLVKDHPQFAAFSSPIHLNNVKDLLCLFNSLCVCPGNPEYVVTEDQLKLKPAYRHSLPDSSTIRHNSCPLLSDQKRCPPCSIYRSTLATAMKSTQSQSSQHVPYKHLPREELEGRLRESKSSIKTMKKRIATLEQKIEKIIKDEGEELPTDQTELFSTMLSDDNVTEFFASQPSESPQRILWEQQLKSSSTSPRSMRWHPALLRLCIALHSKSSSAYNLLRNSGFLSLPHQNTLRNYTHFTDAPPGFNINLMNEVIKELHLATEPNFKTNVCLLLDEMKIKSGLVFNSSGRLIGFCDLGEINNELLAFEHTLKGEKLKLATHVFVIMVRGLFSNLKAPFAYFPCENMSSSQIYPCVMEAVQLLEGWGLRVRAITSDGASSNRKFYDLCMNASTTEEADLGHWTWNPFALDRKLYFLSDPPHLIKTARNNFANSGGHSNTRNLMFLGKKISWQHIVKVHDWDVASGSGLRMLYKITPEHLHLTPTSKMRVSLASQVLSTTVANALQRQGLQETDSTQYFLRMMDLFFDCLNVSNVTDGRKKRKPSLEPYRSADDWRLTFLEEDFLSFLQEWESEGRLVPGLNKSDRGKLCISKATLDGLILTVKSFTALARELLAEEGVQYFLSEKLSQDPLEEHFGKQRGMGGRHDNPEAHQFGSNMLVLQVAGSCVTASSKANVQRQFGHSPMKTHPLPIRPKKK